MVGLAGTDGVVSDGYTALCFLGGGKVATTKLRLDFLNMCDGDRVVKSSYFDGSQFLEKVLVADEDTWIPDSINNYNQVSNIINNPQVLDTKFNIHRWFQMNTIGYMMAWYEVVVQPYVF